METILDTPGKPAEGTYEDRKSEFIGQACRIEGAEDALGFVDAVRQANPKARHVAYAAVWGSAGAQGERMSDDGEPSGTAGKPILDVVRKNGLTGCVVTVTRYFGGILLGSGGLVRAYSTAASRAVAAATRAVIVPGRRMGVVVDYARQGVVRRALDACGGRIAGEEYADVVTLTVTVPADRAARFAAGVREGTAGAVVPRDMGPVAIVEAR